MSYNNILELGKLKKENTDKKTFLLKIIDLSPGKRYGELLRITNLNNGTL